MLSLRSVLSAFLSEADKMLRKLSMTDILPQTDFWFNLNSLITYP